MPEFEPITGHYVTVDIDGEHHRIFVEEAGRGIPLLCLHTAGNDSRQFRHIMNYRAITDRFVACQPALILSASPGRCSPRSTRRNKRSHQTRFKGMPCQQSKKAASFSRVQRGEWGLRLPRQWSMQDIAWSCSIVMRAGSCRLRSPLPPNDHSCRRHNRRREGRVLPARIPDQFGPIDILINNAGHDIGGRKRFDVGSADDWAAIVETNLIGLMRVTRAFLPDMVQRNTGDIVNIGSISGLRIVPDHGAL